MPNTRNRVLITGATGYLAGRIGLHLREDYLVILGSRRTETLKNVEAFQGLQFARFDIDDPQSFPLALKDVDAVIHLAALNHQDCEKDPTRAQRINVTRVGELVNASIQQGVKNFIYMSTIHLYGTPFPAYMDESTQPQAKTIYAKTHLDAESFVINAHQAGKFHGTVFRLANAMGAPAHADVQAWNLVVNDLSRQAAQSRRMVLNSTGEQERNFISMNYLTQVMATFLKNPPASSETTPIYNLGGGGNLTIWHLAQEIQKRCQTVLGYTPELSRPTPAPGAANSQDHFEFNCTKLIQKAGADGWPRLVEEIDRTLMFCKEMEVRS
jgi:UDP-glucose 4-epimerase